MIVLLTYTDCHATPAMTAMTAMTAMLFLFTRLGTAIKRSVSFAHTRRAIFAT
jgi:hypothetical protein